MNDEPLDLLPEMLLFGGAVATLLTGSFVSRQRQWLARLVAVAALSGSLVAAITVASDPAMMIYGSTYMLDTATSLARIVAPAAALLVIGLSVERIAGSRRESEFYVLILLASLGSVLLAGSTDLLLLIVAYLLASIPLYALAGWGRDARGAEAALKLYLMGALLGIVMMLGVTVLYGVGGGSTAYATLAAGLATAPASALALGFVATLAGLLFKVGAVPAHFWVPDAVQGASTGAAAFLTTVPKIGGLIATYRLVLLIPDERVAWPLLIAVVAAATMTLGNLAAFAQDSPARLLGYSTVSQAGYLLMAVAVATKTDQALPALLFYLAVYAVTNLGAFAAVAAFPNAHTIQDYRGLAHRRPAIATVLLVCLLGLVGTPPTGVFIGKVTVFAATWEGGMAWLVVVAAVNTVASLYYYLRWIAPAFARSSDALPLDPRHATIGAATVCGVAAVALGVASGPTLSALGGAVLP
ncbi:NADH-quinone oxidoreductase subunit N [Solicola gregarius]|uniref:NADH-quinone oxidoreductase subunit N n=1 Tax=Solicola gregarius TaxID=2908642 RepID=A0AA46THW8_9ACTN|nr:NADH-quinone oxidoreductase subunit N [Solicola gregarius]UYM05662.1 NADH-quinone oxidoreductase subunit N [Solicola gregarius]